MSYEIAILATIGDEFKRVLKRNSRRAARSLDLMHSSPSKENPFFLKPGGDIFSSSIRLKGAQGFFRVDLACQLICLDSHTASAGFDKTKDDLSDIDDSEIVFDI